MYTFTITPDRVSTAALHPYLTKKDRRSISELVEEITRAKSDAEVSEIAKKIVKIDKRNSTIDKHEKLIRIARDLVFHLSGDSYFTANGLAYAVHREPDATPYLGVSKYGGQAIPRGAAKEAAERLVAEGVLEIKSIKYCGRIINAYYKK